MADTRWQFGLSLKREQFQNFKENFEKIAENKNIKELIPVINIDGEITKNDFNEKVVTEIQNLEPFGEKNRTPIFLYKNLKIDSIRALSEGKHLKLVLKDGNLLINAIGFNLGEMAEEYLIGDKVDVIGNLEINTYNGTLQINLKDLMKSV